MVCLHCTCEIILRYTFAFLYNTIRSILSYSAFINYKMLKRSLYQMNFARLDHLKFVRLKHKLNRENEEKDPPKLATDVMNYLNSTPENLQLIDKLPKNLLRKYKTPESMYLINKKTAKVISNTIKEFLDKRSPLIEVNPGLGLLSEELLKLNNNNIYMFEAHNHFSQPLNELQTKHPKRITIKYADFFGMWKLACRDKLDDGDRVQTLLGNLATENINRTVQIVGSMPGLSFVRHLINSIVFNSTNQLGRPDLFITMPAHHYEFLTDVEIQESKKKSVPTLFQLLFSCKVLTTVPKVHFLPWTQVPNNKKVTMMDEHSHYLVNITQRTELPCPPAYLPLLWYFFKPTMFSKSTRIIPMLEQWIPGCGIWLITGQDPPDTNKELSPGKNDAELPHMTIFTQFGELNLGQKITVFKRFISWPEFEQCQFRLTMENNLPKYVTQLEELKESITHIDDIEHSDSEAET